MKFIKIITFLFLFFTNIALLHLKSYLNFEMGPNMALSHSKFHCYIAFFIFFLNFNLEQISLFSFKIPFWNSKLDQISFFLHFLHLKYYFYIQNWAEYCFFTFFYILIWTKYCIFLHLKSYFENWTKYRFLHFCYSNWNQITLFSIKIGLNIAFLHFFIF